MAIGIPNRSSFLHTGIITQCVSAGLLPWVDYHPAKLFYRLPGNDLWLCRCDDLCKRFVQGDLDAIFTGDDYANEFMRGAEYEKISFAFVGVCYALFSVGTNKKEHFDRIFTKYPKTAKEHLATWNVSFKEVEVVSGSSECFACCIPSAAAFDVVCTGATQQANQMRVLHSGDNLGCSWYFRRGALPELLVNAISNLDLLKRISYHYQSVLYSRDNIVKETVGKLLNIVN